MSRKTAREFAYKLIFEYLFNGVKNSRTYEIFSNADLASEDIKYLDSVYTGVIDHCNELKETVEKYSHGFSVERIYKTDLSALYLAIYEMKYMSKEIPLSVSINEAVLLVKHYSTERSHSFVNGILSSVYKELTANAAD